MKNSTFETFKKENRLILFGHEDAGKEDDRTIIKQYNMRM